ncbi:hypothetical protein QBC35DRAFT_297463 [Podospora australis]|uniref:Uncharacterized protein n=1 Tax=Podospora australis TaxID=1536484 RepID=A0AAN6WPH7_9PEZI|nr:hypothetical protein QBC35DRAFT_297463 [Podospora australis]
MMHHQRPGGNASHLEVLSNNGYCSRPDRQPSRRRPRVYRVARRGAISQMVGGHDADEPLPLYTASHGVPSAAARVQQSHVSYNEYGDLMGEDDDDFGGGPDFHEYPSSLSPPPSYDRAAQALNRPGSPPPNYNNALPNIQISHHRELRNSWQSWAEAKRAEHTRNYLAWNAARKQAPPPPPASPFFQHTSCRYPHDQAHGNNNNNSHSRDRRDRGYMPIPPRESSLSRHSISLPPPPPPQPPAIIAETSNEDTKQKMCFSRAKVAMVDKKAHWAAKTRKWKWEKRAYEAAVDCERRKFVDAATTAASLGEVPLPAPPSPTRRFTESDSGNDDSGIDMAAGDDSGEERGRFQRRRRDEGQEEVGIEALIMGTTRVSMTSTRSAPAPRTATVLAENSPEMDWKVFVRADKLSFPAPNIGRRLSHKRRTAGTDAFQGFKDSGVSISVIPTSPNEGQRSRSRSRSFEVNALRHEFSVFFR